MTNAVGVIDSGYRGEIIGKFRSTTDVVPAIFKPGERFAQLVIVPYLDVQIEEVAELEESDRNEGGFGSTGNDVDKSTMNAPTESQSIQETEIPTTNSEVINEVAVEPIEGSEEV